MRKFPSSTKNKVIKKNLKESLFKDLREINNKIEHKEDYLKKHFYHAQYQRHVGDISSCPVCLEMKKKGILSEKEKGLHNNLNSRNLRNLNRRHISNIKISLNQNLQENKNVNMLSANSIEADFDNKYMQFNGLNRFKKLNRYGSSENIFSESENKMGNFRIGKNINYRENEKNRDDFDRWQFSALSQYFRKYY